MVQAEKALQHATTQGNIKAATAYIFTDEGDPKVFFVLHGQELEWVIPTGLPPYPSSKDFNYQEFFKTLRIPLVEQVISIDEAHITLRLCVKHWQLSMPPGISQIKPK